MNKRKVLIVTYYFNQIESIGSIRLRGLAEYLEDFNWKPYILTVKSNKQIDNSFEIIETEYNSIINEWKKKFRINSKPLPPEKFNSIEDLKKNKLRELMSFLYWEFFVYPDEQKYWYKYALEAGRNLLVKEEFDAILSSSYPVTSHLIANDLKKEYELPWIADLRDLWTQNPYKNHLFIRNYFEKKMEINTLKNADAMISTSNISTNKLKRLHKKKVFTITNGFNPKEVNPSNSNQNNKFIIFYSGRLYINKRDPEFLFISLYELNKENKININDFSLEFYGYDVQWVYDLSKKYNLENIVKLKGLIDRNKIIKKQRRSQLLLNLTWNNPDNAGVIPGKLFEYLAAKRPIVSIGQTEGSVKQIIESTNSGIHTSDINQIKEFIEKSYNEFKFNRELKYNGIESEIDKYSQVEMARKFANVLNHIAKISD